MAYRVVLETISKHYTTTHLDLYPGLLTPAFVLQVTTAGVRRSGYEAITHLLLSELLWKLL